MGILNLILLLPMSFIDSIDTEKEYSNREEKIDLSEIKVMPEYQPLLEFPGKF